jgi:small-conductance mechanosensitive channel
MRLKQNGILILLIAALVAVGIGIYRTDQGPPAATQSTRRSPLDRSFTVDQTSLANAEQLVRLPTTAAERRVAEDALRLADQEMDLAFAQAVRQAANQPPVKSDSVTEFSERLQRAVATAAADQAQVTELTAAVTKAGSTAPQALTDRLELAKAQAALDQDEVDDARQDLQRIGGDPQGRIQAIVADHEAASRTSDSTRVVVTPPPERRGMLSQGDGVFSLRAKQRLLDGAAFTADSFAHVFKDRHDRVEARLARIVDSATTHLTHDSSAALLALTKRRALSEKARAQLDERIDNQHQLNDTYTKWSAVVASQERVLKNQLLRGTALILTIILVSALLLRAVEQVVNSRAMDRRRAQTLYMITRATLQVICVLLILLVIFGPPNNLGTVLGLIGAGLTVALKDFIVGFLGWFVLMGKNGIRIGDLVEINGVTGEVTEIGMFYTVLLETGAWSESHPTGRRVTFNNSFAIEGHYFNFSTSGRWMWDEVRIAVPQGRDPHPIVAALEKEIAAATTESAKQAEEEWRVARRSPKAATIEAAPSISLRPAASGFEITARYITHAAEREELRARLYRVAIEMLGDSHVEPHLPATRSPAPAAR